LLSRTSFHTRLVGLPKLPKLQQVNLNSEVEPAINIFSNSDIALAYLLSTSAKLSFAMVSY